MPKQKAGSFGGDACFFDELSVDSNPKRPKSVRLDKCLLDSWLPCGFCEVSLEVTGCSCREKFTSCSSLLWLGSSWKQNLRHLCQLRVCPVRVDASGKGAQDEFCRHCLSYAKWPLARVEVKPGDGYQMQLLGLAHLSRAAVRSRKERGLFVASVHQFSSAHFNLNLFICSREKQGWLAHQGGFKLDGPIESSTHAFLHLFSRNLIRWFGMPSGCVTNFPIELLHILW